MAEKRLRDHAGKYLVYTDGSKEFGFGVILPSHTIQKRIRDECTVFNAELIAIREVIRVAPTQTTGRICIAPDSLRGADTKFSNKFFRTDTINRKIPP